MPKISQYPSSTPQAGDAFIIARSGLNRQVDFEMWAPAGVPGGRLTLTSGLPVTTSDISAATTVYYTPFRNNLVRLWNGLQWQTVEFSETSLALGTLTSGLPYDVFGYLSSGNLALEMLAWASTSARATAISYQDGRLCKTGDKSRLYLGTFFTTSTTQTADSESNRFLWNMYNRVSRCILARDTTDSYVYSTATFRSANNNNSNGAGRVALMVGFAEEYVQVQRYQVFANDTATTVAFSGIGIDSITVNSAQFGVQTQVPSANFLAIAFAFYRGILSAGHHFIQQLEMAAGAGVTTWYGDAGDANRQSGMMVDINM